MPISNFPPIPSRQDPATFAERSDAFLGHLPTFVSEVNDTTDDIVARQSDVATRQSDVVTRQADVTTRQADVVARQSDVTSKQADVTGKLAQVNALHTDFDRRYLGPKASDPATDNDGNALVIGASYYSTSQGVMKLYNGSAWQVAYGNINGSFTVVREPFTATAGQSSFTLANSYAVGTNSVMVYLNGVRLMPADYVETNSNTITLVTPAAAGDAFLAEIGVVSSGTTAVAGLTSFNPTVNISATNVQAAIVELDDSVQAALNQVDTNLTATAAAAVTAERSAAATLTNKMLGDGTVLGNQVLAQIQAAALSF